MPRSQRRVAAINGQPCLRETRRRSTDLLRDPHWPQASDTASKTMSARWSRRLATAVVRVAVALSVSTPRGPLTGLVTAPARARAVQADMRSTRHWRTCPGCSSSCTARSLLRSGRPSLCDRCSRRARGPSDCTSSVTRLASGSSGRHFALTFHPKQPFTGALTCAPVP